MSTKTENKEGIKEQIIGSWKLVSWIYLNQDNQLVNYLGESPSGILTYDTCGYMSAHLMRSNRQSFVSESLTAGTADEIRDAFFNYVAYWGRYYERAPGEIVHQVEGSLFPNWIGQDQIRFGKLSGRYLILSTPPIRALGKELAFKLTWQKV
jgi:hypothetical protein